MAGGLARSHVRAFVYRRVVRSRKVLWYSIRGNVATRQFSFGDGGHDHPFNIALACSMLMRTSLMNMQRTLPAAWLPSAMNMVSAAVLGAGTGARSLMRGEIALLLAAHSSLPSLARPCLHPPLSPLPPRATL